MVYEVLITRIRMLHSAQVLYGVSVRRKSLKKEGKKSKDFG
jgi:hypothetical protein